MQKIVVIGSGNVATHLAPRLDQAAQVAQVYSRNHDHAQALALKLRQCRPISDIKDIDLDADLYVISLTDTAISEFARRLPAVGGAVVHTSGSVPMEAIPAKRAGVLYPLQTFSKCAVLDMAEVPFFIEASDPQTREMLTDLAQKIAPRAKPQYANSQQRRQLHLAAVFACNFANHLWAVADKLLRDSGYGLEVMFPLMQATLDKAKVMPPALAQTGPAARGDLNVINSHLNMLADPKLKEIYAILSESILKHNNNPQP